MQEHHQSHPRCEHECHTDRVRISPRGQRQNLGATARVVHEGPELSQRAGHQPDQHREGAVTPPGEQVLEHAREGEQARAHGRHHRRHDSRGPRVAVGDGQRKRVQYEVVEPEQQQHEGP